MTTDIPSPLCPTCHHPVPSAARFCGSCGTALPRIDEIAAVNRVSPASVTSPPQQPQGTAWKAWHKMVLALLGSILGIFALLLIIGLTLTLSRERSSQHAKSQAVDPAVSSSPQTKRTNRIPPEKPTSPARAAGTVRANPKDGAPMVWVPTGTFRMGSTDAGNPNEQPQHTVTLNGYWIYRYEVTVAQYRKFCAATGHQMPTAPKWGWHDQHPIVFVTWHDAVAYATWAGARLPTEAEWEKAARGPDGNEYPWGNEWDAEKCPKELLGTHPVGSYPADVSPYGVLDMAGNVREWCHDWYRADAYASSPAPNPTGPSAGTARIIRDGSWVDARIQDQEAYRSARRDAMPPSEKCNFIGFRCAASE